MLKEGLAHLVFEADGRPQGHEISKQGGSGPIGYTDYETHRSNERSKKLAESSKPKKGKLWKGTIEGAGDYIRFIHDGGNL